MFLESKSNKFALSFFGLVLAISCSSTKNRQIAVQTPLPVVVQSKEDRQSYEATGQHFIIATQGKAATEAAKVAFGQGGNIIDAAIAASFAISVERPQSTGIGGGGFMLYREAKTGKIYAIDFRERAPLKSSEKMFLNAQGEIIKDLATEGILAAGTPGMVAGLLEIHKKFGKLPRKAVMKTAIDLAEKGFKVYPHLAKAIASQKSVLISFPASAKIFLKSNNEAYVVGDTLIQSDLAGTLKQIAEKGTSAFYSGKIAQAIAAEFKDKKGLVTQKDLAAYKVKWREPVHGTYKGYEIYSMPPPSSGGPHVIEILNIVEADSLKDSGFGSTQAIHMEVAAMQHAFADRATFMGDPDFYKDIPLKGLLSKSYARKIHEGIDRNHASTADSISSGNPKAYESTETTNFSIMDSEGNMVVSTQTVNGWLGSGVVVPGTGILLNNEMDDFSAKPGASNMYGAVGGIPNSIAPLKTPLSSMAPTLVLKDGKAVIGLGAPGGTRIITCVAQTLLNYLEFKLPLYESIVNPRIHNQWKPDQLDIESPGFGNEVNEELTKMGYKVNMGGVPCRVNAVSMEGKTLHGVADPRDIGASYGE